MFSPRDLLILKIAVRNWRSLEEITDAEARELIHKIDELPTEPPTQVTATNDNGEACQPSANTINEAG